MIFGILIWVFDIFLFYVCKLSGVDFEVVFEGVENVFVLVLFLVDLGFGYGGVDGGGDEVIEVLFDCVIV